MFSSTFITFDNLELKCSATVASNNPTAILIVVHGLGDHSQSIPYKQLEAFLADKNLVLVRYDLRGQGESQGTRRYVSSFSDYREDLSSLIRLVRNEWSGLPVFLLGVSLGGLIVIDHSINAPEEVEGAIVLAPALSADGASKVVRMIVPTLARVFPRFSTDPGLDPNNISRDQDAVQTYTSDPEFSTRLTLRLAGEIMRTISATLENARKLKTPLLVLHGDADVIVPPRSSQDFFHRVTSTEKQRVTYSGARHNLLLETNREEVYSDIYGWLLARLSR